MALATALPKAGFDLIGPATIDGAPPNVRAYGVLTATAYRDVLARCDLGLGTLALYRKGMREASPLKVREYLAYGLPTVIGYDDTDFLGAEPWFLERLPNSEWAVDDHAARVYRFAKAAIGRRVTHGEIAHLGATAKEALRLEFFQAIVSEGQNAKVG
jgi:hypothetical protein